jgi:ribosomal protein S18 acetylase RimI-like enzyme
MIRYQLWASKIRSIIIKEPYWYIFIIAVSPEYQGKGYASILVKPKIESVNNKNETIYLETQNAKNIPIYQKYGFQIIHSEKMKGINITQYCMKKRN